MSSKPGAGDRIYSLDVLRFFAALAVVAFHYAAFGYKFTGERVDALVPIAKYGYLGVDLFFMISGFVVLMSAVGRTPRQFFNSRFVRVVPMFWIACLCTYVVLQLLPQDALRVSTRDFLLNMGLASITPLQPLLHVRFLDGSYWTLVQETMFYIWVWLALITGLIRHVRLLLYGWLAVTCAALLLPDTSVGWMVGGLLISDYAAYFIAGGLFYLIWKERRLRLSDSVALVVCLVLSVYLGAQDALNPLGAADRSYDLDPVSVGLWVTSFFVLFAVLSGRQLPEQALRPWAWLGALTYPLYLLHQHIGYALINKFKLVMPGEAAIGLMFVLALLGAWAAHKWLEVPFTRWVKVRIEGILPSKAPVPAKPA